MQENKEAALRRLRRIEGQIRGITRMIQEDRYCVDVLAQTAAVRSALQGVESLVLDDHAGHCIEEAIASGDADEQRAKFRELVRVMGGSR